MIKGSQTPLIFTNSAQKQHPKCANCSRVMCTLFDKGTYCSCCKLSQQSVTTNRRRPPWDSHHFSPRHSNDNSHAVSVPSFLIQLPPCCSRDPCAAHVSHDEVSSGRLDAQVHAVFPRASELSEWGLGTLYLSLDSFCVRRSLYFRGLAAGPLTCGLAVLADFKL